MVLILQDYITSDVIGSLTVGSAPKVGDTVALNSVDYQIMKKINPNLIRQGGLKVLRFRVKPF